ncbi:MAG: ArsR family transcriptional regulator [Syntrophomonas sp.]
MLNSLITSKTRIKLILKFFLNPDTSAHLRGLAAEFNESTNGVRVELNRLTEAGLLESSQSGKSIYYKANTRHSLYPEIHSIVRKYLGIDQMVEDIVKELGDLELALITGDYAMGIDSGLIDLVLVGEVDKNYLQVLVDKTESLIERKIRTLVVSAEEFDHLREKFEKEKVLLLWKG